MNYNYFFVDICLTSLLFFSIEFGGLKNNSSYPSLKKNSADSFIISNNNRDTSEDTEKVRSDITESLSSVRKVTKSPIDNIEAPAPRYSIIRTIHNFHFYLKGHVC